QVVLATNDAAFAQNLFLVLGFASLALAAAFLFSQRDYKRLLAYSSVENMGILSIGLGLGGQGTRGAILHAINHSLCKAALFLLAGNILKPFGPPAASEVRGLPNRLPRTGLLFSVGLFAIGGSPPFGAFFSELTIFHAAIAKDHTVLGVLFL